MYTFSSASKKRATVSNLYQWVALKNQMVNGLMYLHEEVQMLNSDIQGDNSLSQRQVDISTSSTRAPRHETERLWESLSSKVEGINLQLQKKLIEKHATMLWS